MKISNFGLLNAICTMINSSDDSSDGAIARYLIAHIHNLTSMSSNEVIEHAYVTRSAVRRFCNRLGYRCWSDLQDSFCDTVYPSDLSHRDMSVTFDQYRATLDENIRVMMDDLKAHVDFGCIDALARELHETARVGIICANNTMGNLLRFQQEMFFAGKCITLLAWRGEEIPRAAEADHLLLVVSVSGRYVDESFEALQAIGGKKLLVTVCHDQRYQSIFDEIYHLGSISHETDPLGVYSKYAITYFFDLLSAHYLNLYASAQ